MHTGTGRVAEVILTEAGRQTRLLCPEILVPSPGQYLLASNGLETVLPVPLFYTDFAPQGFITVAPQAWKPGDPVSLRGPLGRGFWLPSSARRAGLIAFDDSAARLRGLIRPLLRREASVVLVSAAGPDGIPDEVEIQPLSALEDILSWADALFMDVSRENLPALRERLESQGRWPAVKEAQVLVRTQMPCGGLAECGVCAVVTKRGWKMACKDGPVFRWQEI